MQILGLLTSLFTFAFFQITASDLSEEHSSSSRSSVTGTPSLYYKEHRIRTEQLCPDLQESLKFMDIDTANYPYKSVFKLADQVWRPGDPCVFESRGPRNQITTAVIKAVQASNVPWNYSGAAPCSEHIKLRLPSRRIFSKITLPICTVRRESNPWNLFQGPYYHPHVWILSRQKMGISFALYENETSGDEDGSDENEINSGIFFIMNHAKLPKFIHIVFAAFYGESSCSLRVQQYRIRRKGGNCSLSDGQLYTLCGLYNCSEEESVMSAVGFWSESLRINEIHKLVELMRSRPPYRGGGFGRLSHEEPTPFDFVITIVTRLLIMPLVFCIAYYASRQFRDKFLFHRPLSGGSSRSAERGGGGGGGGGGSRTSAAIRDLRRVHNSILHPTVEAAAVAAAANVPREDPPPPYETLLPPPSYLEATAIKCVTTTSLTASTPLPPEATPAPTNNENMNDANTITP